MKKNDKTKNYVEYFLLFLHFA